MADRALATMMAGMRERARASNLVRAQVLAYAVEALGAGQLQGAQRAQARDAAHSLAGSAGTFGFAAATQPAQDLEELFADPTVTTADAAAAHLAAIQAALNEPGSGDSNDSNNSRDPDDAGKTDPR